MSTFNLQTRKGIVDALAYLQLDIPEASVFPVLAEMERDAIVSTLQAVLAAPDAASREKAYLQSITFACSPTAVQALDRMGMAYEPYQLVEIGRSHAESRFFRKSFDPALNGDQEARSVIRGILGRTQRRADDAADPASQGGPASPAAANPAPSRPAPAAMPEPVRRADPPAPQTPPKSAPAPAARNYGASYHCYGGKGAVCFQVSPPSQERPEWGMHLDAAVKSGNGYAWGEKINIRFNPAEMPMFLAVLLGFRSRFEGNAHGPKNDKGFSIERQEGKFFVRVSMTGKQVSVPVTFGDAWWVAALMYSTLAKACGLTEDSVIRLVKAMCEQENNATNYHTSAAA
ncbi:hypothetical protein QU487_06150 [Crenobacter sp. SG2305]|uniref:hypothetical protein n=1 Tax=Crenobacter oryzisoli TaxID=3056844 RepID=UPI0025AAF8C0|nr:hypothetical protein [Crenobacter sp. SG2305]MDN0082333.1 hypothetical protein [Crenobacter sp. SG2305]